ncbi:MAG: hypothetical protein ACRDYV_05485 [Acidimicrobiia bacterium]
MPHRMRSSLGIAAGLLGGLLAGVMVSAGAAPTDAPAPSDYEIVRSTFSASGESAEGTAQCSKGKLVLGGGARVLDDGVRHYAIVASDPMGPSGWSATFVRHPETRSEETPIVPGAPGAEEEPEDEGPGETDFEVSAVCAVVR